MLTLFFTAPEYLGYAGSPQSIRTSNTEAISQASSKKVGLFDASSVSLPREKLRAGLFNPLALC